MKIGTCILTILFAASAFAQSPAPKPQAAPQQSAAKPNASSPAKTAAAEAKSAVPAAKSSSPAPAEKQASVGRVAVEKPGTAKPANKRGKLAEVKQAKGKQPKDKLPKDKQPKDAKESPNQTAAKAVSVHQGKRDPFVSPIVERKSAVCTGIGKRCLFIGDLNLVGIVESSNGVIAVVASGQHTYFLRENDPLADGDVERITSDAITLRQRTSDVLGHPVVKEVTRKIGMPAV